jgi:hypothetical protein
MRVFIQAGTDLHEQKRVTISEYSVVNGKLLERY